MGNMSGTYGSHYTLRPVVYIPTQSTTTNTSVIKVELFIDFDGSSYWAYINAQTSGSININGNVANLTIPSINFESGVAKSILLGSHQITVTHNADGSCPTIPITTSWNTNTTRIGSGTVSTTVTPPTIPRYADIINAYVESATINSLTIRYIVSRNADIYCSVNDEDWGGPRVTNTTNGTFTISGLNPNKTYTYRILSRAVGTNLDRLSGYLQGTTLDIARITDLSNFKHGDNVNINISNPAGISDLNLVLKIGEMQILNRAVSTGNNVIKFKDTELDNLYKEYGTESSLTATFILSGSGYTNSKTCIITLTGNQKTVKIKNNNTYKRGKVFININGTYRKAVIWINKNGSWRRCI